MYVWVCVSVCVRARAWVSVFVRSCERVWNRVDVYKFNTIVYVRLLYSTSIIIVDTAINVPGCAIKRGPFLSRNVLLRGRRREGDDWFGGDRLVAWLEDDGRAKSSWRCDAALCPLAGFPLWPFIPFRGKPSSSAASANFLFVFPLPSRVLASFVPFRRISLRAFGLVFFFSVFRKEFAQLKLCI